MGEDAAEDDDDGDRDEAAEEKGDAQNPAEKEEDGAECGQREEENAIEPDREENQNQVQIFRATISLRDNWLHRGDALQDMDLQTYAE